MHTYTYKYMHVFTYANMLLKASAFIWIDTCLYRYTYMHTFIHIHTCIHSYTYKYMNDINLHIKRIHA